MTAYLWVIDLSYAGRLHHGGLLRYFNLSRELLAQGHTVTFAVYYQDGYHQRSIEWMDSLREDGVFTSHFEIVIDPAIPRWNRLATLLLPLGFHNLATRPFVRAYCDAIDAILLRTTPGIAIVSSRTFLFIGYHHRVPTIADFTDSTSLYFWREMIQHLRRGRRIEALRHFRDLLHFFFQEFHSSRRYRAGMVVSPIDKKVFDGIGSASRIHCIGNGVRAGRAIDTVSRKAERIVFSGAMNFPPNYHSALWFLDHVFPLVRQKRPDVIFMVAGASPHESLLARQSSHVQVTGFVPDLNLVLAESTLYVAPLISGSGFKNKIVEAFANGTFVIGTSLAVEFLEPPIRQLVIVKDNPATMAEAICHFLDNPAAFEYRRAQLYRFACETCSWPAKAEELNSLAESLQTRSDPL